jgi:hypothetical protein
MMDLAKVIPAGPSTFDLGLTADTSEIVSAGTNALGVILWGFMMCLRANGPGQCYLDIGTVRYAYLGETAGLVYILPKPVLIPPGQRLYVGAQGAGTTAEFSGRYEVLS